MVVNGKNWVRKPQEQENDYLFGGQIHLTSGVQSSLSNEEINIIIQDLFLFRDEKEMIDYLQVYECSDGRKVFCMDALSKSMLEGDGYTTEQKKEYNHWTMLLSSEY